MQFIRRIVFFFFVLGAGYGMASGQQMLHCYAPDLGSRMRDHNIDVERMLVDIHITPEKGLVSGTVTHYFKTIQQNVDSIILDGPKIRFKKITLDGQDCKYRTNPDSVIIYPPKTLGWNSSHNLEITYEANPKKGMYFIGYNDSTGRRHKQIWT